MCNFAQTSGLCASAAQKISFYKKAGLLCFICLMQLLLVSCDVSQEPAQDAQRNEVLVSLLRPEGAEIITNIEDLLILDSTKPFSDLIHFYKTILFELGVEETGLNDNREGIWIFSGIHEGAKPITIEMRGSGESVRIYIIY